MRRFLQGMFDGTNIQSNESCQLKEDIYCIQYILLKAKTIYELALVYNQIRLNYYILFVYFHRNVTVLLSKYCQS